MVIRTSSSKQIDRLVANLSSDDGVEREAAVARLTVIGARAVERLVLLVGSNAPPATRATALRALEAIGDPRALDPALAALEDRDVSVATAAARTARVFVRGNRGSDAVDRLTTAALDTTRAAPVRIAAVQSLTALEASTLAPLWKALLDDPEPDLRAVAERRSARRKPAPRNVAADLAQALERGLPDDPEWLRDAVSKTGETMALPSLHRLIERVREREAAEPAARRAEWMRVRAAAHVALAGRGSRLAVYDLRESLDAAKTPLPVEFLAALSMVGDRSCLEPIAAAYARSRSGGAWWREHLAEAFRAIAARERITRRHAVMKKIEKRWAEALKEIWDQ